MSWPSVELDPVTRLRILATARPHLRYAEQRIAAPFDRVWSIAGNLEEGVPRYETGILRMRILERDGERLRCEASGRFGPPMILDTELRPGFALMWSGRLEIGLAATPTRDGSETLLAHFEGVRGTGPLLAPFFGWKIRRELLTLSRLATEPG